MARKENAARPDNQVIQESRDLMDLPALQASQDHPVTLGKLASVELMEREDAMA